MENEAIVTNYQNKHLLSTPLYTDMAGGLNTRVSPPQMGIAQSQIARNVVYNLASGAISSRAGTSEHSPYPIPLAATSGLFAFTQAKYAAGVSFVAVGGSAGSISAYRCEQAGGPWVSASVGSLVPPGRRVSTAFLNDTLVCFDGTNPPYHLRWDGLAFTATTYWPLGTVTEAPQHLQAAEFVCVFGNKLYAAGSNSAMLSWSSELALDALPGSVPDFPAANRVMVGGVSDGDPIMGLAVAYGHLIVFKRNSIYAISDSSGVPSQTQIGRSVGLVSRHSFCNAENSVWFWGPAGAYSIGSDLTPQYESDFVMPDYKDIAADFAADFEDDGTGSKQVPSDNHPVFAYNQNLQQVWISCYKSTGDPTNPHRNIVYIHDLINKDSSGRAAISTYVFYQSANRNYTPVYMVDSYDAVDGSNHLFSVSRHVNSAYDTIDVPPIAVPQNAYYIYQHDVDVSTGELGDDGNLVDWEWQSKALNLGDPLRLKALRYYTVMGDPRDEVSTQYTNQNYIRDLAREWNQRRYVFPVAARGVASVCVGSYIYCFGGLDVSGNYLKSIYIYDIANDVWTTSPQLLSVGTAFAEAIYADGNIHFMGGSTATSTALDTVTRYPVSSPGVLGVGIGGYTMAYPRTNFSVATDGEYIYCLGSTVFTPALAASIFERIALSDWSKTNLQSPLGGSVSGTTLAYDSTGTGYLWFVFGSQVWRWSISGGSWVLSTLTLPTSNVFVVSNIYNGKLYLSGGAAYSFSAPEGGAPSTTCLEYTPAYTTPYAGTVKTLLPLASARKLFGRAFDPTTGYAYIIGGTGIAVRAYFESTDDFKTYESTDVDITLNVRSLVPTTISRLARYWAITFKGRISEGIARVVGFNLDYVMFQRRG